PTRLSIHAGPIFFGNIGAGLHYEFGVTGDTITTASRLDGLNKYLGTKILISAEVANGLSGFFHRKVGTFLLKGKNKPITAYELICRESDCQPWQKDACAHFEKAQAAFEARRWDEAIEQFTAAEHALNGDQVSQFYLKMCTHNQMNP